MHVPCIQGQTGDVGPLPECELRDWSELSNRGFMMDISHTKLQRIEEIKKLIDFLDRRKVS